MELVEQMPKVETAEFDPIGLFFLLVAVVPVVHWLWNYFSKSVDIEEWASARGLGFVEYDREFGRELSRLLSLPGQDHVARDVIAVPAPYGSCLYGWIRWIERNEGSRRDDAPERVRKRTFVRYPLRTPLPYFSIEPEGRLALAHDDINTEWEEFNKEWDIRADDEAFAHALLSPVMQAFIHDNMRGMELTILGGDVYVEPGGRYRHEESIKLRNLMVEWDRRVVPFLWGPHGA